VGVEVERVVVHGQQAEHVVVELRDRLARPVLVGRADLELLIAATELHLACSFCPFRGHELPMNGPSLPRAKISLRSA
jgi:hypothetical protein